MNFNPFTMVVGIILIVAVASVIRARWTGAGRDEVARLNARIDALETRIAGLETRDGGRDGPA